MILRQDVWLTALEYPRVGGGGGCFKDLWVGVCGWDPGPRNRYHS